MIISGQRDASDGFKDWHCIIPALRTMVEESPAFAILTSWWFQPPWKIWKSVGMIIPNIWKFIKVMFQTTNQILKYIIQSWESFTMLYSSSLSQTLSTHQKYTYVPSYKPSLFTKIRVDFPSSRWLGSQLSIPTDPSFKQNNFKDKPRWNDGACHTPTDWFVWENFSRKPHDLHGKIYGFRLRFSLKPTNPL